MQKATHAFTVKEWEDGTPSIALEVRTGNELPILAGGSISLSLRPGTALPEARELRGS